MSANPMRRIGKPDPGAVTRWWWVRHAPVPNPELRCYGQLDKDADCSNAALFAAQAKLLPGDAIWYASNLARAIQTAKALGAAGARQSALAIEPALAEQDFGQLQGLTYEELGVSHGENQHYWLIPPSRRAPGGESFVDLFERSSAAIRRLTTAHAGGNIVAVAHGGTIRAALGLALNLPPEAAVRFETDNVSVTLIEHIERADPAHAWRVVFVNRMPHG